MSGSDLSLSRSLNMTGVFFWKSLSGVLSSDIADGLLVDTILSASVTITGGCTQKFSYFVIHK